MESILNSIKRYLGIHIDDNSFDEEIMMHANGALSVVNQLGVGPPNGFRITGFSETWDDFMGSNSFELVKEDVFLRVKLNFDPPANSFLVTALKEQLKEYDWRIEVYYSGNPSPVTKRRGKDGASI